MLEEDEKHSGILSMAAKVADSEKFSTDMIEMTVDARQRLRDFRRIGMGATATDGTPKRIKVQGTADNVKNNAHEYILQYAIVSSVNMPLNIE